MPKFECRYAGQCSGCPWIDQSYQDQKNVKLEHFRKHWSEQGPATSLPEIKWVETDLVDFRDRTDMTFSSEDGLRYGLYGTDRQSIQDIEECVIQSPALKELFSKFRKTAFPVPFGSFRLRVGPQGQRGVWLDFPNISVKGLLDEQNSLRKLMSLAHVEIGQRKKVLVEVEGQLKLHDPIQKPWFQTYLGKEEQPQDLYCSIADFTQPSMKSNQLLIREVMQKVRATGTDEAMEVGAGIGNLTLPLAYELQQVQAYELERSACASLEKNIEVSGLKEKVQVFRGDILRSFSEGQRLPKLMVVDPPRSGFTKFFERLLETKNKAPFEHLIYVSCFAESFCRDAKLLSKFFDLNSLSILDQFPHSPHYEMVASFSSS